MVYIVLGMHKSGTTLVANMLHSSGINMISDENQNIEYDKPKMKAERKEANFINSSLLNSGTKTLSIYRMKMINEPQNYATEIKLLIDSLNKEYDNWGFKDPQTSITYEIWKEYLPEHKVIVVFRNLYDIWPRYKIKNKGFFKKPIKFFTRHLSNIKRAYDFIHAWSEYNFHILDHIKNLDTDNLFVTEYNDLMTRKDILDKLSNFSGRTMVDKRDSKLYRSRNNNSLFLTIVIKLYNTINKKDVFKLYRHLENIKMKLYPLDY